MHGDEAVEDGLIRDITLPSLPQFRDFASQAMMDVMYYLTPRYDGRGGFVDLYRGKRERGLTSFFFLFFPHAKQALVVPRCLLLMYQMKMLLAGTA